MSTHGAQVPGPSAVGPSVAAMSEPTAPHVPAGTNHLTGPIPPYFGPMSRSERTATAQTPAPRAAEGDVAPDDPATRPTGMPPAGGMPAGATAAGAAASPADAPLADAPLADAPTAEARTVDRPAADGGPDDVPVAAWALTGDGPAPGPDEPPAPPGAFPTTPVSTRPSVRARRRAPMVRMGPWAPAAGALLGLVAGLVVVAVLAGRADAFAEGLALVFLTVGLTMLGAAGALLADEVRLVRRGAREAAVRPAWVEATAGLLNGLTPARLLLVSSAFVLFLAAYVGR